MHAINEGFMPESPSKMQQNAATNTERVHLKLKSKVHVFWFRRDLRLRDNTALHAALMAGLPVVPLFIYDTDILSRLEDRDDKRVQFIHRSLEEMNEELKSLKSSLQVRHGKPLDVWKSLIQEFDIDTVYLNRDYEPYAIERDEAVRKLLKKAGVSFVSKKDQVIFDHDDVTKDDGKPYTVYTPYAKKWKATLNDEALKSHPSEKHLAQFAKLEAGRLPSLKEIGFEASEFQYPSPEIQRKLLVDYAKTRNTPSVLGTSRLGAHLRFGTISIRECVRIARDLSETWLNELIWREFFMQILFHFPHVAQGPFRNEYAAIKFRHDEKQFQAWCEGRTGYPIVDAGMRELNATGFMHNRVRMIAASFLVKHLLIEPKWGEAYFARKLLDFDLASNNGNWQWVAGTGCDAAPYFRVFSPEAQEKKFDSKRIYIKKWIPEFGTSAYPEPIVDHAMARARVLAAYNLGLGKKAPEPTRKTSTKRSLVGQV